MRVLAVVAVAAMVWVVGGFVQLAQLASPSGIAVPDAGRERAAGAAVGDSAPAGESKAVADDVAERIAAPEADRASGEPRVLPVRVCRAFCQRSWHYTGPLVVTAGDDVVVETELINSRPLELVAPARAATLVFKAPGLSPAELAADSVDPKRGAEVVLQPREQLRVEVHRPLAAAAATAKWSVRVEVHTGENGSVEDKGSDSVCVPFVAGASFRWQASLRYGTVRVDLSGEQPALAPAEQRVLAIDFASVPTQRYRVAGPSPQLLANCVLQQQWGEGGARRFDTMPLGPDGTCELVPLPDSRFSIGGVALHAAPGGDVVLLQPERELQGVGLVDSGATVSSSAFGSDGKPLSLKHAVHVAAREVLQRGVWLGNSFLTAQQVPARALAGPGDLVLLPVEPDAVATGSLRVRVRGEPPAAEVLAKLRLVARITGEKDTSQPAAAEVVFALPAGSGWSLHWSAPGRALPIAKEVVLRDGETVDVDAAWPQFAIWTGDVAGYTELPRERRWSRVTWGDGAQGRSGGSHAFAHKNDARFELALVDGEALDPTWRLHCISTSVAASCDVVDAAARRFVVSPAKAVRWVTFAVEAEPPWHVAFLARGVGRPFPWIRHDQRHAIPVAAGERLHGCLLGGRLAPGGMRTLAWWTAGNGDDEVRVRPAGGRTVELRPSSARAHRGVALVGPHGQWDMGHGFEAATPLSLWVPDGTRAVVVYDWEDTLATARELPLGPGDVVVID